MAASSAIGPITAPIISGFELLLLLLSGAAALGMVEFCGAELEADDAAADETDMGGELEAGVVSWDDDVAALAVELVKSVGCGPRFAMVDIGRPGDSSKKSPLLLLQQFNDLFPSQQYLVPPHHWTAWFPPPEPLPATQIGQYERSGL
jgi:hypothetical protein